MPAEIQRIRDDSQGGLIITAARVGNNDVIGAAIAHMGLPLNVVADDSSFPELFEYLRASASSGARRSSRGATCARSSACCGAARCSACWSTGAIAATGSR